MDSHIFVPVFVLAFRLDGLVEGRPQDSPVHGLEPLCPVDLGLVQGQVEASDLESPAVEGAPLDEVTGRN